MAKSDSMTYFMYLNIIKSKKDIWIKIPSVLLKCVEIKCGKEGERFSVVEDNNTVWHEDGHEENTEKELKKRKQRNKIKKAAKK